MPVAGVASWRAIARAAAPAPMIADADRLAGVFTFEKGGINHSGLSSLISGQLRSCSDIDVGASGHWIPNAGSSNRTPRRSIGSEILRGHVEQIGVIFQRLVAVRATFRDIQHADIGPRATRHRTTETASENRAAGRRPRRTARRACSAPVWPRAPALPGNAGRAVVPFLKLKPVFACTGTKFTPLSANSLHAQSSRKMPAIVLPQNRIDQNRAGYRCRRKS